MPQLDPSSFASQLFWLFISFTLLYVLLSRFILPPLLAVTERRKSTREEDIGCADQMRQEAEHAKNDYERTLYGARERSQFLINEALLSQKTATEKSFKNLDKQIALKLADAGEQINVRKKQLIAELTPSAADLALAIVENLTMKAPKSDIVKSVVDQLTKARSEKR